MSKFVHNNISIECLSAEVISRRIDPSSYVEYEGIGKCFTYKCSLNSEALIKKELNPKKQKINQNSYLDLNVKLECDKLFVAINRLKPISPIKVVNHSGRHKAQTFTTDNFTFAQITSQIHNIPLKKPEIAVIPVKKED